MGILRHRCGAKCPLINGKFTGLIFDADDSGDLDPFHHMISDATDRLSFIKEQSCEIFSAYGCIMVSTTKLHAGEVQRNASQDGVGRRFSEVIGHAALPYSVEYSMRVPWWRSLLIGLLK